MFLEARLPYCSIIDHEIVQGSVIVYVPFYWAWGSWGSWFKSHCVIDMKGSLWGYSSDPHIAAHDGHGVFLGYCTLSGIQTNSETVISNGIYRVTHGGRVDTAGICLISHGSGMPMACYCLKDTGMIYRSVIALWDFTYLCWNIPNNPCHRDITIWFADTAKTQFRSFGLFFGGTMDKTLISYHRYKK